MRITITLYPKGENPILITLWRMSHLTGKSPEGLWNIENNVVWLSPRLFVEFSKIEKQSEKYEFFQKNLKQVSSLEIS